MTDIIVDASQRQAHSPWRARDRPNILSAQQGRTTQRAVPLWRFGRPTQKAGRLRTRLGGPGDKHKPVAAKDWVLVLG